MGIMMSSPTTLKDLITAAQADEPGARGELVDRLRDDLDRHLRLRMGAHLRKRVEIDDVFQETFTKALQSIESFQWKGEGSFLRWLKAIAENQILALAKKHRRDEVLLVPEPAAATTDDSPSAFMRRGERFDRFRSAIDNLPPDYREVIVLARLEGLRLREVAERMDRSPNAVAHLLSRALNELKAAFGDTESLSLPARRIGDSESEGRDHEG